MNIFLVFEVVSIQNQILGEVHEIGYCHRSGWECVSRWGGCHIVRVNNIGWYWNELRLISPSGDKEYCLSATEAMQVGQPVPPCMKAWRDRIVQALTNKVEIVDLRVKDPVEVTGTN